MRIPRRARATVIPLSVVGAARAATIPGTNLRRCQVGKTSHAGISRRARYCPTKGRTIYVSPSTPRSLWR